MVTQRACTAMKISGVRIFEMFERLTIAFVSSLKLRCSTEVFCGEAYLMQDGHCHGAPAGAYGYSTLSAQVPKLCSLFIHLDIARQCLKHVFQTTNDARFVSPAVHLGHRLLKALFPTITRGNSGGSWYIDLSNLHACGLVYCALSAFIGINFNAIYTCFFLF